MEVKGPVWYRIIRFKLSSKYRLITSSFPETMGEGQRVGESDCRLVRIPVGNVPGYSCTVNGHPGSS